MLAGACEVEIFTRATASTDPPIVRVAPGVLVRNVVAGPFEGLDKYDLPTQLCAFAAGVLRAEAAHEPGYYDIVHSHYWLSGQVGWLARDRWSVPLVHTAHTLAAVKNAALAEGDTPEPPLRTVGEQQVVDEADRLIANTEDEAEQLVSLHHADPARIDVAHPGVDLDVFRPGDRNAARANVGATARRGCGGVRRADSTAEGARRLAARGGQAAAGARRGRRRTVGHRTYRAGRPRSARRRIGYLCPGDVSAAAVAGRPGPTVPVPSTLVAVPSYSESFGLVALEAQACGTPVVAAAVGGLPVAVRDGVSGTLVAGHDVDRWAQAIDELLRLGAGPRAWAMRRSAVEHAATFSWDNTVDALLASYRRAISDFTPPAARCATWHRRAGHDERPSRREALA